MKVLKLLGAALAAVTMAFTAQAAKTAKAVVLDGGKTLRFVYDSTPPSGTKGTDWFEVPASVSGYVSPWKSVSESVTKVVFADSFKDYRPKQCGGWFEEFKNLSSIENIGNLVTANVTDMSYMFYGCSSLEAICASDRFVTDRVSDSSSMFQSCSKLVGGAGTAYDSTKTDATYARIDGGPSAPGYFTRGAGVYKIRFAANGGAGTMADQTCVKGKIYNLRKCALTAPTGKAFAGWACKETGKLYADGILVFDLAEPGETVTMTAVWK